MRTKAWAACNNGAKRTIAIAILAALFFLAGSRSSCAQSPALTEYEVKAAFLYNFAKFVEWPADSSAGNRDTITIAVLGHDPFGNVLDQTVADKTIRGRRISIRRVSTINEALACQIVFIGLSEERRLGDLIKALQGKSVLTIGETEEFVHRGGIISFRIEGNKVRFEVNLQAAERARLTLSSQLLKLARIVTEDPRS